MTYTFFTGRIDLQTIQTTLAITTENGNDIHFVGYAKCRKGDTYNYEIGKLISSLRAAKEFFKQSNLEQEAIREDAHSLIKKNSFLDEKQRENIKNIIQNSYQKTHLYTKSIYACNSLIEIIPQLYEEFGNFMDNFKPSLLSYFY